MPIFTSLFFHPALQWRRLTPLILRKITRRITIDRQKICKNARFQPPDFLLYLPRALEGGINKARWSQKAEQAPVWGVVTNLIALFL